MDFSQISVAQIIESCSLSPSICYLRAIKANTVLDYACDRHSWFKLKFKPFFVPLHYHILQKVNIY